MRRRIRILFCFFMLVLVAATVGAFAGWVEVTLASLVVAMGEGGDAFGLEGVSAMASAVMPTVRSR